MEWTPKISKADGPRYLALAGAIAHAIDNGELSPGAQLPPQRDLAERLGVTVGTVGRAYALAKSRRLVTGEVGRGTFVCSADDVDSQGGRVMPKPAERDTIDLVCYRSPVPGLGDLVAQSVARFGEESNRHVNAYAPDNGFLTHRIAGATWIARAGLSVGPEQVMVVNGAQQGITAAVMALCRAGDTILTEAVTYSGLRAITWLHGVQLHGVGVDPHGMVPAEFDAACVETGARVAYVQPTLHNPTTATMPTARRKQIAEIARKRGVVMIEDDAGASALHGNRPPALSSFLPDQSCYITSVSKSISPSFRLGYVACTPHLYERLSSAFQAMSLAASPLIAQVVAGMIGDGSAEQIAKRTVDELSRRQRLAVELLKGFEVMSDPSASFLWLTLPSGWDSGEFVAEAKRRGVSVVSSVHFAVDRSLRSRAIRIRLCPKVGPDALKTALGTIVSIMRSNPPLNATVI